MTNYTGRCLCGAITYNVAGPPVVVAQCHCDECRRTSGTGHAIGAMFAADSLTFTGTMGEFKYQSRTGSEVTKCFCGDCGSPILGRNTHTPDHVTLALGAMDDATKLRVEVVIFERDKQAWDSLGDNVMTFDTQPDWKPPN
ncbi:GFA family protein [Cochlodiniinecator piscidefendens]|uniref:GFA family protein n=1 Tax=Cochlodiniinecator piscidefendens TaxID=2715756 RepID=UPI00140DB32E|nr:GFA family protein [Cochlodiniinecator piscidefendens]